MVEFSKPTLNIRSFSRGQPVSKAVKKLLISPIGTPFMAKLVVNPRTQQAFEIQLKPGTNHLGRGITNDFKLNDLSVSGSHCQIVVGDGSVIIKDLGSTNGTFVNRSPIQEAR